MVSYARLQTLSLTPSRPQDSKLPGSPSPVLKAAVPLAYIECGSKDDVQRAVRFAVENKMKLHGKGVDTDRVNILCDMA